jgi:hypothetical protein
MEIDMCPICGCEMMQTNPAYVGQPVEGIPKDAMLQIACVEIGCGEFQITRKDRTSMNDEWVAEYVLKGQS